MSLCNVVKVGVEKVFRALLIVRYSTISSTPNFSSLIFFGCYPSGSPYRILIDFCDLEMDHDLPVQVNSPHVPNTPTIKDVSTKDTSFMFGVIMKNCAKRSFE